MNKILRRNFIHAFYLNTKQPWRESCVTWCGNQAHIIIQIINVKHMKDVLALRGEKRKQILFLESDEFYCYFCLDFVFFLQCQFILLKYLSVSQSLKCTRYKSLLSSKEKELLHFTNKRYCQTFFKHVTSNSQESCAEFLVVHVVPL